MSAELLCDVCRSTIVDKNDGDANVHWYRLYSHHVLRFARMKIRYMYTQAEVLDFCTECKIQCFLWVKKERRAHVALREV